MQTTQSLSFCQRRPCPICCPMPAPLVPSLLPFALGNAATFPLLSSMACVASGVWLGPVRMQSVSLAPGLTHLRWNHVKWVVLTTLTYRTFMFSQVNLNVGLWYLKYLVAHCGRKINRKTQNRKCWARNRLPTDGAGWFSRPACLSQGPSYSEL